VLGSLLTLSPLIIQLYSSNYHHHKHQTLILTLQFHIYYQSTLIPKINPLLPPPPLSQCLPPSQSSPPSLPSNPVIRPTPQQPAIFSQRKVTTPSEPICKLSRPKMPRTTKQTQSAVHGRQLYMPRLLTAASVLGACLLPLSTFSNARERPS